MYLGPPEGQVLLWVSRKQTGAWVGGGVVRPSGCAAGLTGRHRHVASSWHNRASTPGAKLEFRRIIQWGGRLAACWTTCWAVRRPGPPIIGCCLRQIPGIDCTVQSAPVPRTLYTFYPGSEIRDRLMPLAICRSTFGAHLMATGLPVLPRSFSQQGPRGRNHLLSPERPLGRDVAKDFDHT